MGGKTRLAPKFASILAEHFISPHHRLVEPFVGGFNIVPALGPGTRAFCADLHPGLITLYQAVQIGWQPPEILTSDEWTVLKGERDWNKPVTAFAAFGCSFGGMEFSTYARHRKGVEDPERYAGAARRSLLRKAKVMELVEFECCDYVEVPLEPHDVVYADPPYAGTTGYSTGDFNHRIFWDWCEMAARKVEAVYVSEFTPPDRPGWEVVWELERKVMLNSQSDKRPVRVDLMLRAPR